MRLLELKNKSKVVVVYGGGFQPFHQGHMSSYLQAKQAFPGADFYVAASNDTKTRPIPFEAKQFLAQQAGVADPFVQVSQPINPKEILANFDPEQDILVLVRSERDPMGYTKKDGTPGYYQPFVSVDQCEPFGKHGYILVTKKHVFDVNGEEVYSGSQVRTMYASADDAGKANIIKQLYPKARDQKRIKQVFDQYLSHQGVAEGLNEFAQGDFNGSNDNNDLQLYLNVAKKLNMKKYKPSTAHNLIAKKMAELVDAVDDEKVDWARHMARKAQGLPSMLDQQGVAEGNLKEFAPGSGGGESGRWYTDDQMTDLVGDGWWNDLDVSGDISKQEMIQEAQAWLDDQGYSVQVLNCKVNDDDMEWYIEGSFQNSGFAKKGMAEGYGKYWCSTDKRWKQRQGPKQTRTTEEFEAQFDIIEEWVEQLAEQHGVDAEVIWEDFEVVNDHELLDEAAAWQKKSGKNKNGGLNAKGVASYRREHPGSKLQTAVTTKPSKLKKGSKAAKRRKSFCARMGGMKGPMKKDNGEPTRKALALRKWNC